jgi:hypothetical protein
VSDTPAGYDVQLYPILPDEAAGLSTRSSDGAPQVGLCFSGGGTRSLTCSMGYLRALHALGLLDRVSWISSVSGGTWAAAPFTWLPARISDDEFLGPVVAPQDITASGLGTLAPNNLGQVPTKLGYGRITDDILKLKEHFKYPTHLLWQAIIGKYVLQPFGLWNQDFPGGFPDSFYTLDAASAQAIQERNPSLANAKFFLVERPRPTLIMNGSLVSQGKVKGSQLLPFESTQHDLGVRRTFQKLGPDGRTIGGGKMESFAMGSAWQQDLPDSRAQVTVPSRPWSLSDMASVSGAAFAETFQAKLPFLDSLDPEYQYWPIASRESTTPVRYLFADGGSLENSGVASMVSRGVPNVIAFINSQTPLSLEDGEVVLDPQIPLLFGLAPSPKKLRRNEPNRAPVPNENAAFTQVFPSDRYEEVAHGLWNAHHAGGPAIYLQTLETVANPNYGVEPYPVRILWVYNTAVQAWYDLLKPDIQKVVDKTSHFPNYDTLLQLELSASEVNLLAHLACWNLMSQAEVVKRLFGGG